MRCRETASQSRCMNIGSFSALKEARGTQFTDQAPTGIFIGPAEESKSMFIHPATVLMKLSNLDQHTAQMIETSLTSPARCPSEPRSPPYAP